MRKYKGGGVEEDIRTVTKDPWSLEIVENKHDEDVIITAVDNNGMVLQIVSEKYMTKDIIITAMMNNGLALQYVPVKFMTKEICNLALMYASDALYYVPDEIIDHDIIGTIISTNPSILNKPEIQKKLSRENIEYIKTQIPYFEMLDLSPPDVLPPELERQYSDTYMKQGASNCGATSFSKVILKNVFETLDPIIRSNTKSCNTYLNTSLTEHEDIENLTPTNCSPSGYLKILLFLHIFNLYKRLTEHSTTGVSVCWSLTTIYPFLYSDYLDKSINKQQQFDTYNAIRKIKEIRDKYNVTLVTFSFKDITLSTIKKITDNGLYITLGISNIDMEIEQPEFQSITKIPRAHYLTIVGTFEDYILLKNQWGPDVIYKHKLGTTLVLDGYTWEYLNHCICVIPFMNRIGEPNMQYDNVRELDKYLIKYQELKRVIQHQRQQDRICPSRDKIPSECTDRKNYLHQSSIFHPDRNFGCKKEAIEKFTKLQTLRGCTKGGRRKSTIKNKKLKTRK